MSALEKSSSSDLQLTISELEGMQTQAYVFLIVAIVAAITCGFLLTKNIMEELGVEPYEAAMIASNLAVGNTGFELNKTKIRGLYKDMRTMMMNLGRIVRETIEVSDNLALSSQQFSSGSQKISEWANEQTASAEEVASSMEEIVSSIHQNATNAEETEKISGKATTLITEVNESVKQTVSRMSTVSEKIKIIGEIVQQTNILALNAAVEASRAGEHGKGFAVIASEVRKLAEKSSTAADEIIELTESSVEVASKSDQLLTEVIPDIKRTSQLVQDIVASSKEQSLSSEQINNALQHLNETVQHNAAAAEEMAGSSNELRMQAESLKNTISFFRKNQK
ncbi:MAG: methyl-accepting chemotaxis protein [Cyclobacteriaceae bacterium]